MRFHVSFLAAVVASTAQAEPHLVDGASLKAMFAGATIRIDTPLSTTIPLKYALDGQVIGEAGSLAFMLGASADRGRWWIEKDRVCQKFQVWFEGDTQCLRIRVDGDRIYWTRDDGKTGTATVAVRPPVVVAAAEPAKPHKSPAAAVPPLAAPRHLSVPSAKEVEAKTKVAAITQAETTATPEMPAAPTASATPAAAAPAGKAEPAQPLKLAKPKVVVTTVETGKPKPAVTAAVAAAPSAPAKPVTATATVQTAAQPAARMVVVTPTYRVVNVASGDVLNVRIGPSVAHSALGGIAPDARGVKLAGACNAQWCYVRHGGLAGWVNRAYLLDEPAPLNGVLATEKASATGAVQVRQVAGE